MATQLTFWDEKGGLSTWLAQQPEGAWVLDPFAMPEHWRACIGYVRSSGDVASWAFVGVQSPLQSPLGWLGAIQRLRIEPESPILAPTLGPTPLARSLRQTLIEICRPDQIVFGPGLQNDPAWPTPSEPGDFPSPLPEVALRALDQARWLALLETSRSIEIPMTQVAWLGGRLGTGVSATLLKLHEMGISELLHAEVQGSTGFLIAAQEPPQDHVMKALKWLGVERGQVVLASQYQGLLVGLAHGSGQDVGLGMIEELDYRRGMIRLKATVPDGASIKLMRLGLLRYNELQGRAETLAPWSL